jgi:hypothetical protein
MGFASSKAVPRAAEFFKRHRLPGRLDSLGKCPHVASQQQLLRRKKAVNDQL